MKRAILFLTLASALAACTTADARSGHVQSAGFGQPVRSGPFTVQPLRLLEDSRCPRGVTCVWAGQIRIEARITGPGVAQTSEMTLGKPVAVGRSGSIGLTGAEPERATPAAIAPRRYRFAFTFYPEG